MEPHAYVQSVLKRLQALPGQWPERAHWNRWMQKRHDDVHYVAPEVLEDVYWRVMHSFREPDGQGAPPEFVAQVHRILRHSSLAEARQRWRKVQAEQSQ